MLIINMNINSLSNQDLFKKYQPLVYLHDEEEVSPISFENYILECELYSNDKLLLEKNNVKIPLDNNINSYSHKQLNYIGKYTKPNRYTINYIPIYGKIIKHLEYIDIVYMFFYPYNKGYKILGCFSAGEHQADLEYVIIRINKSSQLIDKIFYSAHGDEDQVYSYTDIDFIVNRKTPIVYVAKNSHANYNKPGTYCRIFGFANDVTTDENMIVWKSENIVDLDEHTDLLSYDGKLGFDAVDSFNRRKILRDDMISGQNENPSCCFRYCLPFME